MTETKQRWKSRTIIGGVVLLVGLILKKFDFDIEETAINELVQTGFDAIGVFMIFYGRLSAEKKLLK